MRIQVSKVRFKDKALELFREVEGTGQAVIVTDHGRPTIEVRKYRRTEADPLERLKGTVLAYEGPMEPVVADDREAV